MRKAHDWSENLKIKLLLIAFSDSTYWQIECLETIMKTDSSSPLSLESDSNYIPEPENEMRKEVFILFHIKAKLLLVVLLRFEKFNKIFFCNFSSLGGGSGATSAVCGPK